MIHKKKLLKFSTAHNMYYNNATKSSYCSSASNFIEKEVKGYSFCTVVYIFPDTPSPELSPVAQASSIGFSE